MTGRIKRRWTAATRNPRRSSSDGRTTTPARSRRSSARCSTGRGMRPIESGMRVLIKPNFLAPAAPERAMTTHPLVVRAVVEHVLGQGGRPTVADSPGRGSFERLLREGGYAQALAGLDVAVRPFRETVKVDIGAPFGRIDLAREAVQADLVVNLPKLKTHTMMLLTLGVKNLFGCVVGLAKPEWHMRSGIDRTRLRAPARPDPPRREPGGHADRRHPRDGGRGPGPQRHPAPPGPARGRGIRAGPGRGRLPAARGPPRGSAHPRGSARGRPDRGRAGGPGRRLARGGLPACRSWRR